MPEHLLSNSEAVPLQEQAAEEARMALEPLSGRKEALLAALGAVDVKDDEDMRRAVDKIVLSKALREHADGSLAPIGRPYQEAIHAVRSTAGSFLDPLRQVEQKAQQSIDAYRRRQREAAARSKTEQEERERQLRIKAGLEAPPEPAAPVKAADVKLSSVRSDYRGQVFDRKVTNVTITDPRALPDTILKAPAVIAAMESAARRLATLTRDIPGAEIEDDRKSSVKAG